MTDLPALPFGANDYADALRRLALAQQEIDHLNVLRETHNEQINTLHRDLHDAAKLIGDVHHWNQRARITLGPDLGGRVRDHVKRHGHPQDVPEEPA